ncbi:TIGR04222 domain-containing membrane protein [Streptomyces sp. Da 82-17]|uniref:TIGR04222 domain-containing membrane protein n=1 Tax=Streptomyces sp. Da 82-17 TaxID=3377116 RepID=UPI0038D504A4
MTVLVTFLVFLYYVGAAASTVGLIASAFRARAAGTARSSAAARELGPLEAAFLTGGPGQVADAALTAMHADGLITVVRPGLVGVGQGSARHPVEQAVLDAHAAAPSSALEWIRIGTMRSPAVQAVGDDLARRGLLVRPDAQRALRSWAERQMLLSFGAGPVAIGLTFLQFSELDGGGTPLPFFLTVLPACLAGYFGGWGFLAVFGGRCTAAGKRALRDFRRRADGNDPLHLVACFGPRSAPDPLMREQLTITSKMRATSAGPGGSGSSGHPSFVGDAAVTWCGGGDGASCGGPSCGSSSAGAGGGSGGGWSSGDSSGGSSCGGSSGGGGSSCGSSS